MPVEISVVTLAVLAILMTTVFLLSYPARRRRKRTHRELDRLAKLPMRRSGETDDQLRARLKDPSSAPPLKRHESEHIRRALDQKPAGEPDKQLFITGNDYF